MNEILTIEEMEEKYAGFWVLIGDPEVDELQQLRGGRVLFHSTSSEDIYQKDAELPPGHYGYRSFVPWPKDTEWLL